MTEIPTSVDDLSQLLARQRYVADVGLSTVLFLALRLSRPLLIEGEAGVGKSRLLADWQATLGRAGSVPDFAYSGALKQSAIVWDEKSLDHFLAAPMKAVPGTSMTYAGIPDRQERADLIAYLRQVDQTPACRDSAPSAR